MDDNPIRAEFVDDVSRVLRASEAESGKAVVWLGFKSGMDGIGVSIETKEEEVGSYAFSSIDSALVSVAAALEPLNLEMRNMHSVAEADVWKDAVG